MESSEFLIIRQNVSDENPKSDSAYPYIIAYKEQGELLYVVMDASDQCLTLSKEQSKALRFPSEQQARRRLSRAIKYGEFEANGYRGLIKKGDRIIAKVGGNEIEAVAASDENEDGEVVIRHKAGFSTINIADVLPLQFIPGSGSR